METINTEILVSSLFFIGFDKIDGCLFTYTLGQLSIDNYKSRMYKFIDQETYSYFNEYVIFDGFTYRLKDGITLDTNVSPVSTRVLPLKYALHTNKKLIEYLSNLDFRKIILKKIKTLGIDRVDNFDSLFCDKEKEIISDMFGIKRNYIKNNFNNLELDDLYDEESAKLALIKAGVLNEDGTKKEIDPNDENLRGFLKGHGIEDVDDYLNEIEKVEKEDRRKVELVSIFSSKEQEELFAKCARVSRNPDTRLI